jgi:hypothetical protein
MSPKNSNYIEIIALLIAIVIIAICIIIAFDSNIVITQSKLCCGAIVLGVLAISYGIYGRFDAVSINTMGLIIGGMVLVIIGVFGLIHG